MAQLKRTVLVTGVGASRLLWLWLLLLSSSASSSHGNKGGKDEEDEDLNDEVVEVGENRTAFLVGFRTTCSGEDGTILPSSIVVAVVLVVMIASLVVVLLNSIM